MNYNGRLELLCGVEFTASGTDEYRVREDILNQYRREYESIYRSPFHWSAMGDAEKRIIVDVMEDETKTGLLVGVDTEIKFVEISVCDGERIVATVTTEYGLEWVFIAVETTDGEEAIFYMTVEEECTETELADYLNNEDNDCKGYSCGSWNNLDDAIDYFIEEQMS